MKPCAAGPSYTADTLAELAEEYPGAELYLVIGADQLLAFKSWVRWTEVLDLATLAVAQRPPQMATVAAPGAGALRPILSGVDVPFVPLSMPLHNISATAIRARAFVRQRPRRQTSIIWCPTDVASYISTHSLYQDPT